jgi:hypothetical protein
MGVPSLPVAGDLQHRRARQAAVGEQQVFEETPRAFLVPVLDAAPAASPASWA